MSRDNRQTAAAAMSLFLQRTKSCIDDDKPSPPIKGIQLTLTRAHSDISLDNVLRAQLQEEVPLEDIKLLTGIEDLTLERAYSDINLSKVSAESWLEKGLEVLTSPRSRRRSRRGRESQSMFEAGDMNNLPNVDFESWVPCMLEERSNSELQRSAESSKECFLNTPSAEIAG